MRTGFCCVTIEWSAFSKWHIWHDDLSLWLYGLFFLYCPLHLTCLKPLMSAYQRSVHESSNFSSVALEFHLEKPKKTFEWFSLFYIRFLSHYRYKSLPMNIFFVADNIRIPHMWTHVCSRHHFIEYTHHTVIAIVVMFPFQLYHIYQC